MKLMAAGDQVLVAEFGDRIDEAVNDQVHALAAKIEDEKTDFENSMLLWGAVWSGSGRHGTVDRAGSERDD